MMAAVRGPHEQGASLHPNGELIREGFEAFAKGDMDTVSRLFDDDIKWHAAGTSALSGDFQGKEAVFAFFGKLMELTRGRPTRRSTRSWPTTTTSLS
jgi:ketosteroid isomerase-like protein